MGKPQNAMEIFVRLDKSNCSACGEKTCLAFAGAVLQGRRPINACPRLDQATLDRYADHLTPLESAGDGGEDEIAALKQQVVALNLDEAARRIGGSCREDRLTVKILGKDFSIDTRGTLYSDIHTTPWVTVPFLTYVLHCQGKAVTGDWVSFREIRDGQERYPLFRKRTEESLLQLADSSTDLFDDMVHLFGGRQVLSQFRSDISVVLTPLPLVPIMVSYWKPEPPMDSSLNLFFDSTVDDNLGIDGVYTLVAGFTQMLERLAMRHSRKL